MPQLFNYRIPESTRQQIKPSLIILVGLCIEVIPLSIDQQALQMFHIFEQV